jgi:hypothetical protein
MRQKKSTKTNMPMRAQKRVSKCNGHCVPSIKGKSSAFAVIRVDWVLCQQCHGLLTVAASSSPMAASCVHELTLPTHHGQSRFGNAVVRFSQ